jgi:hypothetical protein
LMIALKDGLDLLLMIVWIVLMISLKDELDFLWILHR